MFTFAEAPNFYFLPIVLDNFFRPSEFSALSDEFSYMQMELCNWSDSSNPFLFFGVRNSNKPLSLFSFSPSVILKSKKHLRRRFKLDRIHINGQVYGQEGQFHQDSKKSNFVSVLIFTNKTWDISWGGPFAFIEPGGLEVSTIAYVPNRAVIFPSNIFHCGQSPLRCTDVLRTSVVYVFETYDC